ncbi:hypothetical protein [Peptoniphilus sp. EMRHCC_23]|uniref:hypothetical protein n=1 Tax=Peptoniphilus rachelemmaiella TaxID=2811779 RepID=UPI001C002F60|nr:hypothetical protein [Peptoniphilus rachelemmaiella]
MQLDIDLIAKWATAFIAIFSFARLIVTPFTKVMTGTKATLKSLEDTIQELRRDILDSQKDRDEIHRLLETHDDRINKVEDEVIRIDTYCTAKTRED